ncbi:MAG: hypothetical protein KDD13_12650 [Mangrovimonas sp.]|nr:hypothetical protein [Mangrovimonas sp.]
MKRPLSILLLIVFLLPQFAKVGIFISFKANQDFIAKVLCINKDKPELQCNGKCHLAKELNKTESKDQNSPITITNKTEILLFFEKQKIPEFRVLLGMHRKKSFVHIKEQYTSAYRNGVFHPPKYSIS